MEEVFLVLVVVRDESETFVAHNTFDGSTRHTLLTFRRWLVSSDQSPLSVHEHTCCSVHLLCRRAVDSNSTPHHRMRIVLVYEFRAYPSILPLDC